ncbi:MAG: cytochrome c maturation protein CcmE [Planctomycetota bacterium]|jgi:cytochrome c-type biogenesis protein CcmE
MRLKLAGAGLAIAIAVIFLARSGIREGWVYYLPVDQFISDDSYHDQRVRLHGAVAERNLDVQSAGLTARFDLRGEAHGVRVEYTGVIPDMFKPGNEVVVEGRLDESGVFRADTLLTKCASKYESARGEAPHPDPRAEGAPG